MHLMDRVTTLALLNGNQTVQRNLATALTANTPVGISSITEAQIRTILMRTKPAALGMFDSIMQRAVSAPWDSKCAHMFATIDAKMPANHGLAPLDLWAAVHSIAIGAIFISNIGAIHLIPGVMVKDWTI